MSDYTGMSLDRELARLRQSEMLQEAADLRADRASTGTTKVVWLAVSAIGLVLIASAAWLILLS